MPGVLAFAFGWLAFRSRVTGVYLSIITQAMTYALLLAFFRNDMGFGGNNGLTDFKDILGFDIQAQGTRNALYVATIIVAGAHLRRVAFPGDIDLRQGPRRHPRRRKPDALPRLPGRELQTARVRRIGLHGGARRRALRAAGRNHQSIGVPARQFDRGGDLGGRGGAGNVDGGGILGAVVVNFLKTIFTSGALAPYWLFVLGSIFVLSTLFLPKGIVGTAGDLITRLRSRSGDRAVAKSVPQAAE